MKLDEMMRRAGVWRAGEISSAPGLSSGYADLDRILPGGGWPRAGLTEILSAASGIGALRLVLPALARLSRAGHWLIWVAPPYVPYAPALHAYGVDLTRLLVVDLPAAADTRQQVLWAYEQALKFADCAAALVWLDEVAHLRLRRLQLAAASGATWGIVFRPRHCATEASPAPLRLELAAGEPGPEEEPGSGCAGRLCVTLRKARGAHCGTHCLLEI